VVALRLTGEPLRPLVFREVLDAFMWATRLATNPVFGIATPSAV
jgi:hypothetical protein